jgi:WD40 repeat protein
LRNETTELVDLADDNIAVLQDLRTVADGKGGSTVDSATLRVVSAAENYTHGVLRGHRGRVDDVALSRDHRLLLSGSEDGTARLWEIATGKVTVFAGHAPGQRMTVALSPDARHVATSSQDGTVRLWRADAGGAGPRIITTCQEGLASGPSVLFAPDGLTMAIGCLQGIRLWSMERNQPIALSTPTTRVDWLEVPILAFAGDRLFASGFDIKQPSIGPFVWNVRTGAFERMLSIPGYLNTLHASPDGTRVVAAFQNGSALLWRVGEDEPVVFNHTTSVTQARMLADSERLVTVCEDGSARLWDTAGRQLAMWRGFPGRPNRIALSQNGLEVALAQRGRDAVHVWEFANSEVEILAPLAGSSPNLTALAVSADRSRMAAAFTDGRAYVWRLSGSHQVATVIEGDGYVIHSLAFSPDDASRLVAGSLLGFDATLWNADNGQRIARLSDPERRLRSLYPIFAGNGALIATRNANAVMLWDSRSGAYKKRITLEGDGTPRYITDLSFSRDAQRMLAIGQDRSLKGTAGQIWSGPSLADHVPIHHAFGGSAVLSPDGSSILMATNGEVRLLDARGTGGTLEGGTLVGQHRNVSKATFAPDGHTILSIGYDTARVWSAARLAGEFPISTETFDAPATFSPDSTRLLVFSPDGKPRLWDVASRTLLAVLPHERAPSLGFTTAGIVTGSGGDQGTVRLWRYPPTTQALVDYACSLLTRPLSRGQRREFLLDEDPKDPACGWHPDMKVKPPYTPNAAR